MPFCDGVVQHHHTAANACASLVLLNHPVVRALGDAGCFGTHLEEVLPPLRFLILQKLIFFDFLYSFFATGTTMTLVPASSTTSSK